MTIQNIVFARKRLASFNLQIVEYESFSLKLFSFLMKKDAVTRLNEALADFGMRISSRPRDDNLKRDVVDFIGKLMITAVHERVYNPETDLDFYQALRRNEPVSIQKSIDQLELFDKLVHASMGKEAVAELNEAIAIFQMQIMRQPGDPTFQAKRDADFKRDVSVFIQKLKAEATQRGVYDRDLDLDFFEVLRYNEPISIQNSIDEMKRFDQAAHGDLQALWGCDQMNGESLFNELLWLDRKAEDLKKQFSNPIKYWLSAGKMEEAVNQLVDHVGTLLRHSLVKERPLIRDTPSQQSLLTIYQGWFSEKVRQSNGQAAFDDADKQKLERFVNHLRYLDALVSKQQKETDLSVRAAVEPLKKNMAREALEKNIGQQRENLPKPSQERTPSQERSPVVGYDSIITKNPMDDGHRPLDLKHWRNGQPPGGSRSVKL
jgi:hypothetical protein